MILPATVWADEPQFHPYDRQNTSGYIFDGHKWEDVVVKPYSTNADDRKTIDLAKTDASGNEINDNQVVFLYNIGTGRFLYPDGGWGTEAVGRYKGFGLPFNIVDPTGGNSPVNAENYYFFDKVGLGFYSEAANQGHYLGRNGGKFLGEPTYFGEYNKTHFFFDRGGNDRDTKWDENLKGNFKRDDTDRIPQPWAETDNVVTWHLEKVDKSLLKNDENVIAYRLAIYMPNKIWDQIPVEERTTDKFIKHYVKLEEINPFSIGGFDPTALPYYALTTKRNNTQGDQDSVEGDEVVGGADFGYLNNPEYFWQIVTRKDLKEKFLLDYNDPFTVKVETGNATFNLENPDFSRPLNETVGNHPGSTWNDAARVYNFSGDAFNNDQFGRAAFLHPQNNGTISQKFKPYQYGLFRLDVQGFTFNTTGNPQVKMSVSTPEGVAHTPEVTLEEITAEDGPKIYSRIGDVARLANTKKWRDQMEAWYRGVTNQTTIFQYDPNGREESELEDLDGLDYAKIKIGSKLVRKDSHDSEGWWAYTDPDNVDYSKKCLYRYWEVDEFGRKNVGVYINGKRGIFFEGANNGRILTAEDEEDFQGVTAAIEEGYYGPWEYNDGEHKFVRRGYGYNYNGQGWLDDEDGVIEVEVGKSIILGPLVSGYSYQGNNINLQWWTPNNRNDGNANDPKNKRDLTIGPIKWEDAGDYICTVHIGDTWNAFRYTLVVKDPNLTPQGEETLPEASHVIVNGDGVGYKIDETGSAQFSLQPSANKHGYNDLKTLQNAIAATDPIFVDRAVGEFLYNDENKEKYVKSVYFYVPENSDAMLKDIEVFLTVAGVSDPLKQFVALDNVRLTYAGDTPFILDDNNKINENMSYATGNSRIPVYMNRNFFENAWNAFVCPIPLNGKQVKAAFGDGVKISEITGLGEDNNYRIVFTKKEFRETDENVIVPGRFYIVNPSKVNVAPEVAQIKFTRDASDVIHDISIASYESGKDITIGTENIGKGNFISLGNHDLRLKGSKGDGTGDELLIPVKTVDGKVVINQDQMDSYNPYDKNNTDSRYKNTDYDVVLDEIPHSLQRLQCKIQGYQGCSFWFSDEEQRHRAPR